MVHEDKTLFRTGVQTSGHQGHQQAAKFLTLNETGLILAQRSQLEEMLPIEQAADLELAKPTQLSLGLDFEKCGAEGHPTPAGRRQMDFELCAYFRRSCNRADERVPVWHTLKVDQ